MAEFSDIGGRCTFPSCGALDFLPMTCKGCSAIFCTEHHSYSAHECPTPPDNREVKEGGTQHFYCDVEGCGGGQNFPVTCVRCKKNFCLTHRYDKDHNCEKGLKNVLEKKEKGPAPDIKVKLTTVDSSGKIKKNAAMANKVRFMKMKLKAQGDTGVNQENRFYLDVFLPRDQAKVRRLHLFFHKDTVVGKVLDLVATKAEVPNRNNSAPPDQKIYLFDKAGNVIPNDRRLGELEGAVDVGDVVILAQGLELPADYLESTLDESLTV